MMNQATLEILTNHLGYSCNGPKFAVIQVTEPEIRIPGAANILTANGKVVHTCETEALRSVKGWKQRWFSVVDFSGFQTPGQYCIGVGEARSFQFEIHGNDGIVQECLSDILHYFKSQRCGGIYEQHDHQCPVHGEDRKVDVHGGWYDASGDVSKYLSHLSYTNYLNPQQTPMVVWNLLKGYSLVQQRATVSDYTRERVVAEALHGADFLMRMQDPDGSFYMIVFDVWSKDVSRREICSYRTQAGIKSGNYRAGMRQGGGMAIAALAAASRYGNGIDFSTTEYLAAAEKGYRHLQENNHDYLNDGKENIIDAYCGLMAAVELFKATGDNNQQYLEEARNWADSLASYRGRDQAFGEIWFADSSLTRPYFHAAEAGLPVIALMEYLSIETDEERSGKIRNVTHSAISSEMNLTDSMGNPFEYPSQVVQDISGNRRLGYFVPHQNESGYWWQGENARLASLAAMAWLAVPALGDNESIEPDRLNRYAYRSIDWILGLNPFNACMLDGHGWNNPTYWPEVGYFNAKGGICNGVTSGFDDEEDIALKPSPHDKDPLENWRWGEQWIPHAAWFFLALAAGPGRDA